MSKDYFKKHNMTLAFRITESTHIYNSLVNTMKYNGLRIVSSDEWNVMWTGNAKPDYVKNASKF
jgi:hypothetical protein